MCKYLLDSSTVRRAVTCRKGKEGRKKNRILYLNYLRGREYSYLFYKLQFADDITDDSLGVFRHFNVHPNLLLHSYLLIHVFSIKLLHYLTITIDKLSLMFFTFW